MLAPEDLHSLRILIVSIFDGIGKCLPENVFYARILSRNGDCSRKDIELTMLNLKAEGIIGIKEDDSKMYCLLKRLPAES